MDLKIIKNVKIYVNIVNIYNFIIFFMHNYNGEIYNEKSKYKKIN